MDELIRKIREMKFEQGCSNSEISHMFGVTIEKVKRVTCKRYDEILKKKEIRKKAEEEFVDLVKKYLPVSNSLNHLCNNLGLKGVDGYYKKLNRIIEEYNLSTEHFGTIKLSNNGGGRNKYTAMSDEEFFVKGVKRHGESIIKRLVDGGYKEYKCEGDNCGINEWNGKPLRLQVHHINGDHNDNRIENLQLLCPNCHTQTDTYARSNVVNTNGFKITKRVKEISNIEHKQKNKLNMATEILIEDFKSLKSFSAVGKKYGVSDNAIRKKTKKLGIYDEIRQFITPR